MELSIDIDTKALEQQLANLADRCGLELGPIIKAEAKYLVESAIKNNTPPPSRQAGERTVANDLAKVAIPLDYRSYEQKATGRGFYKSLARYVRDKNVEKLKALMRNPNFHLFKGMDVVGSQEALHARHYSRRRYGRVRQKPDAVAFSADYKRTLIETKRRVGFMVSGWNKAADAVGARKKKFADRPYEGSVVNVEVNFGRNPFFLAINRNIRIPQFQKLMNRVIAHRLKITTQKVERAQKKLAINLGFTRLEKGSY
jgi:hypothetical protein